MTPCPHCAKSIRTDAGMAFHLGWCKAPAAVPAPTARPTPRATIRPKARKAARRARGPEARRQSQAASLAAYAAAARTGEHLPACYADAGCVCALRNRPTPEPVTRPVAVLDALTLCNGCDMRPMADNAAGYCAECLAAAQEPEPTTPSAMPAPKAPKARAPKAAKSGKAGGLPYGDGAVLIAGGRVRVSREAGDYSDAVLRDENARARGKSWTMSAAIGIDKLRPSPAEGYELGPWAAWGAPAPKAAPIARRAARRPVGPGSCWCPRDHRDTTPSTARIELARAA